MIWDNVTQKQRSHVESPCSGVCSSICMFVLALQRSAVGPGCGYRVFPIRLVEIGFGLFGCASSTTVLCICKCASLCTKFPDKNVQCVQRWCPLFVGLLKQIRAALVLWYAFTFFHMFCSGRWAAPGRSIHRWSWLCLLMALDLSDSHCARLDAVGDIGAWHHPAAETSSEIARIAVEGPRHALPD